MYKYDGNILIINNQEIRLASKIKQVLDFNQIFIVLLDDERMPNNIIAYNKYGKEIWRINDILKIDEIGNFSEIEKVSTDILGAFYVWGIYYQIDVEKRLKIKQEYTR